VTAQFPEVIAQTDVSHTQQAFPNDRQSFLNIILFDSTEDCRRRNRLNSNGLY